MQRGRVRERGRGRIIQGGWASPRGGLYSNLGRNQRTHTEQAEYGLPSSSHEQNVVNFPPSPSMEVARNLGQHSFVTPSAPDIDELLHKEEKKETKLVTEDGWHVLSRGKSGIARVWLTMEFICAEEADRLFNSLRKTINFKERQGRYGTLPRLTAWFGVSPYMYAGVLEEANTEWPDELIELKKSLEANTMQEFNSVLVNLYRNGRDSVAWHSDDELGLGKDPFIASLSLGDQRNFELKKKRPPNQNQDPRGDGPEIRIPLKPGSLLLMVGATQSDWLHRVPKEYHDRGERINLTFRKMYPELMRHVVQGGEYREPELIAFDTDIVEPAAADLAELTAHDDLTRTHATTEAASGDRPTSDRPTSDRPTSDLSTSDLSTSDRPTSDRPTSDRPSSGITSDRHRDVNPRRQHVTSETSDVCIICYDRQVDQSLFTCEHNVICQTCFDKLSKKKKQCPVCRKFASKRKPV